MFRYILRKCYPHFEPSGGTLAGELPALLLVAAREVHRLPREALPAARADLIFKILAKLQQIPGKFWTLGGCIGTDFCKQICILQTAIEVPKVLSLPGLSGGRGARC